MAIEVYRMMFMYCRHPAFDLLKHWNRESGTRRVIW